SGPGVPEDVQKKMFNPFFTTRATGTGLGLAIVHRIMDAHGGRVSVRNHAQENGVIGGAVVELLFPVISPVRCGTPEIGCPADATSNIQHPTSPIRHSPGQEAA